MRLGPVLKSATGIAAVVGALAGVLLVVTLFLAWGEIVCVREPCPNPTGWQTLRVLDIPIAVLGVAAAVVAVLTLLGRTARTGLVLTLVGVASVVLVLIAPLVERKDTPLFEFGGGWTLALVAALIILACGATIWVVSSGMLVGDGE